MEYLGISLVYTSPKSPKTTAETSFLILAFPYKCIAKLTAILKYVTAWHFEEFLKRCPICPKGKRRIQSSFIHKAESTVVGLKENAIPD